VQSLQIFGQARAISSPTVAMDGGDAALDAQLAELMAEVGGHVGAGYRGDHRAIEVRGVHTELGDIISSGVVPHR